MNKLLKVDLNRVFKDKLLLIVSFIGLGFAIVMPFIFKLLLMGLESEGMTGKDMGSKFFLFNSFSPTNNFGLILPIFLCIIICKDFSQGTVRNKIIYGHRRKDIFLSMFITIATYLTSIILIYGLINFALSLILGFGYSAGTTFINDIGYLLLSLLFVILAYVFLATLISFLIVFAKNVGVAIVLYFALTIGMTMLVSILQVVVTMGALGNSNQTLMDVVTFALNINPFYMLTVVIGKGVDYSTKEVLCYVLSTIIYVVGLFFAGAGLFAKKDLK